MFGGKIFGYREIDLAINKDFDLSAGVTAYIRADFLNIFNYHNYSDYFTNYGSNGSLSAYPVAYQQFGNISGPPREFKVSFGFRF